MKPQYKPVTQAQKVAYFVEEVGEALAAVGKAQRWGIDSVNPELPPAEQETNRAWIRRELADVLRAVRFLQEVVGEEPPARPRSVEEER